MPDEVLEIILKKLSLRDAIKCRTVSQDFKTIIDNVYKNQLIQVENVYYSSNQEGYDKEHINDLLEKTYEQHNKT